ncbi:MULTISPECIES: polyprenyl diphosphate synthase [Ralstonia solanacearum species complex]|uniref:polyprenyl diphosphate synthase n=1 Tax=Ralstonia solanacearum species complex TaxID=3116862 RepID=UPI00078DB040|nr:polyprenyl diphosphate synthase [Ralstonia solanacearum]BEU72265.1 polyprenyl diphosphate synthase [Ralstonia pseudosolanacearum]AMP37759.1 di-trans,poly-cis-decaprenylcistransferase [Ralstonia solanacearum]AXV77145.1 di-trans,poly-cis-decaprenylcistransferase [Ralstonia solanacearum]AXV86583.1 di-trans,poly-cis-decaprenylcistransferase [Ralstonia solanacearum]AXV91162.1 di-trans,poly-cis-decaprenylcistransferase [Ralstonia solanacearum]
MHISSTLTVPDTVDTPRHVAIIMDGNGRWATERHLPRMAGHSRGLDAVRAAVEAANNRGVRYLTLFAFSSENWRRPAEEISFLMKLFMTALRREVSKLHDNGIRLRVVGDLGAFSPRIQLLIREAEAKTAANSGLTVTIAANYGGRWDILQAMRALVADQPDIAPEAITEEALSPYLSLAYAPEPDLFIRTSGEQRISNFLLWQLAYSELYFTERYWPDFDAAEMDRAFAWYRNRERRFGRTSAQVEPSTAPALSAGA